MTRCREEGVRDTRGDNSSKVLVIESLVDLVWVGEDTPHGGNVDVVESAVDQMTRDIFGWHRGAIAAESIDKLLDVLRRRRVDGRRVHFGRQRQPRLPPQAPWVEARMASQSVERILSVGGF